jgi:alpha-glucosidase
LNWDNAEVRAEFLRTLRFWADRGVDGFRIDVAHLLAKDLTPPLPAHADLWPNEAPDGTHRLEDRDAVQEIYQQWRRVFNEYDPPRAAVAEAWVPAHRRPRYASAEGLGQAFNFDLLQADWDVGMFRSIITDNLKLADDSGASSTWVLSNHDVVRHRSRYALPPGTDLQAWLASGGRDPAPDVELGLRRARAATLLILALPGSTYLYQGEELGLPEVADLPETALQDPTWVRTGGAEKGRDGCRVPLPWTLDGPSFGFGSADPHLPQPAAFGDHAVEAQLEDPGSTLLLYRTALAERRRLQGPELLQWQDDSPDGVLQFSRPGGWTSITNFGAEPAPLPAGEMVVASGDTQRGVLPPSTTAWLQQ